MTGSLISGTPIRVKPDVPGFGADLDRYGSVVSYDFLGLDATQARAQGVVRRHDAAALVRAA